MARSAARIKMDVFRDEATLGLWAECCLLPSGFRVPVMFTVANRMEMRIYDGCMECGQTHVAEFDE